VVATSVNRATCERLWNAHPTGDHRRKGTLTCYEVGDAEDRLGGLLNVLPALEEHHGEVRNNRFSFPNDFLLQVIGLTPGESVINALREFGFSSFLAGADGFRARI
jgi:hypothetical protein